MKRRRSFNFTKFKALSRAGGVAAAVVLLVSGVTFAALQSQQSKLTGNTIRTATAGLQISADDITYTGTQVGFSFNGLVPGGAAVPQPGNAFYLKNTGTAPLALKFGVSGTPSNPDNVDLSKVNIILTMVGGTPQTFTLQSLIKPAVTA